MAAKDIRGVLLCGGKSSRFGADKLLSGTPPIAMDAARNLLAAVQPVLAVVPLGKSALREALEGAGCQVLETDRTSAGMSGSLVAAIEATESAAGWIVALGDMPRVRPRTIASILDALLEDAAIALPTDASGRRGHPVGFASSLREELLALQGDLGARSIVARHAARVRCITTDDPGIFVDIDTPGDLATLQEGKTS